MAARKRSRTRKARRPRRTTAAVHRAPARRASRRANPSRRGRRGSVVARSRRRVSRRRNPSGKLLPLVIGGGVSALVAGFLPSFGAGPIMQAAKLVAVGWGLEKFLGRTVPSVFGEARDGAIITAGGMLFQSFVAPQLGNVLSSVMPSNGKGVNGIALTQYPFAPQLSAPMAAPAPQKRGNGVNGMATAAYPFR